MMSSCTSAAAWKSSSAAAAVTTAGSERGLLGGPGIRVVVVLDGGDRLPAPVAEQGAEALAAGEEVGCGLGEHAEVG